MDDELVKLASVYQTPGFLWLATSDQDARLGCVGVRALSETTGEMRRLFVRPQGRGLGLGKRLTTQALAAACTAGFHQVVLNTLPAMVEAIELYQSVGFTTCEPYVEEPLDGVLYFSLDLSAWETPTI